MFVNVSATSIYVCFSPGEEWGELSLTEKFACVLLADVSYIPEQRDQSRKYTTFIYLPPFGGKV